MNIVNTQNINIKTHKTLKQVKIQPENLKSSKHYIFPKQLTQNNKVGEDDKMSKYDPSWQNCSTYNTSNQTFFR